jgi:general secretion pathway protein G
MSATRLDDGTVRHQVEERQRIVAESTLENSGRTTQDVNIDIWIETNRTVGSSSVHVSSNSRTISRDGVDTLNARRRRIGLIPATSQFSFIRTQRPSEILSNAALPIRASGGHNVPPRNERGTPMKQTISQTTDFRPIGALRRHSRGFTLIELMIVIAIVAILAAVAIPNLIAAADRSKQKATMLDIRQLSHALERFAIDHNAYPRVSSVEDLRQLLEPEYIRETPVSDGWGNRILYQCAENGQDFTLVSFGKDGVPQAAPPGGEIVSVDDDIIFANGRFTQKPANHRG